MKECRLCGARLPIASFYVQKGDRRQSQCIPCTAVYARSKRYNLTIDEARALLLRSCAGCGANPDGRELHVDHDHETGRVRGVLCHNCNTVLTKHMTPAILRRLADYLEG